MSTKIEDGGFKPENGEAGFDLHEVLDFLPADQQEIILGFSDENWIKQTAQNNPGALEQLAYGVDHWGDILIQEAENDAGREVAKQSSRNRVPTAIGYTAVSERHYATSTSV